MAYLGRGLDKISNIEVLDNITFDGSSSYSITKGSVAFTPNSAQSCLISIDGIVQATNFTVNSSTIDFGVAIPSTSVCNFFLHYGTGLITVPSDGSVTESKIGSGAVTSSKLSAGKILQVVTASNDAVVSTTSTSFVDITSVTASITPISTSNKIMVIYSSDGFYPLVAGTNVTYHHQVLRDSTVLGLRRITCASASGGLQGRGSFSFTILDNPSSTATLVYKAQHKISSSSSTAQASDTSIVLMEVSG